MRRAAFPGSFNPPTVAHLAIAEAVRDQWDVEQIDFVVSRVALAKEHVAHPPLKDRVDVLGRVAASRPWLAIEVTDAQLLADIADGYDVLVLGADKWLQIQDPVFYGGSAAARDAALARLPELAVVPRPPHVLDALPARARLVDVPPGVTAASSTAARAGERRWMAPEAAAYDEETGCWSDPDRYAVWAAGRMGR